MRPTAWRTCRSHTSPKAARTSWLLDRLCERNIEVVGEPRLEGARVTIPWQATYTRADSPPLQFSAIETAEFVGDRIRALADIYDDGAAEKIEAWMRDHGEGLDFNYA